MNYYMKKETYQMELDDINLKNTRKKMKRRTSKRLVLAFFIHEIYYFFTILW